MFSKKLTTLLATFSRNDLQRFRKYLQSPVFNENDELLRLFDLVEESLRQHRQAELDKEDVWKQLFGNKRYHDNRLRRLGSELLRNAYGYLALSALQNDAGAEQLLLLRDLAGRGLVRHFKTAAGSLEQRQNKKKRRDAHYHEQQYRLAWMNYRGERDGGKQEPEYFRQADFHLEGFYLSRKLRHFCEALRKRDEEGEKLNVDLPPSFLGDVKNSIVWETPAVQVFYLAAQMLMNPGVSNHFRELKHYLDDHAELFSDQELNDLYGYLVDYCQENKQVEDCRSGLFELLRTRFERGQMPGNGKPAPDQYGQMLRAAVEAGEYDWADRFMRRYGKHQPRGRAEEELGYQLAGLYFHQGRYDKVIDYLRGLDLQRPADYLQTKLLLLKTYFEQSDYMLMDSLIESFRIFLNRTRALRKKEKKAYANLLDLTEQLSKILPDDTKARQRFRQKLKETSEVVEREWLESKVG